MYVEQELKRGRSRRVWVGKRPAVLISRAGCQLLVFRPRLARALGFKVGVRVTLDVQDGEWLAIAVRRPAGRGGARTAGRAKRA